MQNQIDLLRSDGKEAVFKKHLVEISVEYELISMPFTFLNPFKSLNL